MSYPRLKTLYTRLLLTVLLSLANAAVADEPEDAYAAARQAVINGNPAEAYYQMRVLAEDGDEEAAYYLGWMYHEGLGVKIDDREAVYWWQLAAEDEHIESLMALGLLHQRGGTHVRRDTARAIEYYLQAAAAGEEDARLNIAALLLRGDLPALRRIRQLLRREPEILGQMMEVGIEYASARSHPRNSASVVATIIKGTELVRITRQGEWLYVGLPAKRKLAWIHESAVSSEDEDD